MAEKIEEYKKLLSLPYEDAVESLLQKYGPVIDDYFREKSYNRFLNGEIKSITKGKFSKTSEGLYCHHIFENKYHKLSDQGACKEESAPYEVHIKESLVYCDLVEHFILHILIAKDTNGLYGMGGVAKYLLPSLVKWYALSVHIPNKGWQLHCYEKAKISPSEIADLFVETKKILPYPLAISIRDLYQKNEYHYTHEEEEKKKEENNQIIYADTVIRNQLLGNKQYFLPFENHDEVCEQQLKRLQKLQKGSSRAQKVVADIIGQWLVSKVNVVIKARERQLNPQKYENLNKIARFEQMRAEEQEKKRRKIALQNFYLAFHKKYPNLQKLDIEPDIPREKIVTLLYKMYYNTKFKSKKEYKIASINMLRDDLLAELNDRLK